jgi:ABC-2 type transport system ATP-binding protein
MTVKILNLEKKYLTKVAVQIPELTIPNGTCFGLVGANGAGKTTLLRLILDLVAATEGRVMIDNTAVAKTVVWKKRTSSYLGKSYLIDFMTPEEYFQFVGAAYQMTPKDVAASVAEFSIFLTHGDFYDARKLIRDMSSGIMQKVGIIAAIMVRPKLLILDEPFNSLDPAAQVQLNQMLQRLSHDKEVTIILSSHNMSHVVEVCSRIAIMADGRIVRDLQTSKDTRKELLTYFARTIDHDNSAASLSGSPP